MRRGKSGFLKVHGHSVGCMRTSSALHCVLSPSALMPTGACPSLDSPKPFRLASFVAATLVDDMAQTDGPEPSQHAFNPNAILDAYGDNGAISDLAYEVQSSSDAFKYASSPEKRNRLLDELLKRRDSRFEAILACMLFKIRNVCSLIRYIR